MNAITRHEIAALDLPVVSFTLNGRQVSARANEPLIAVADREGVQIPRLCYKPGLDEVGNIAESPAGALSSRSTWKYP